jgi:hypothetical protein
MRKTPLIVTEDGKWYRVSLRFMGDHLPVNDIDAKLGLAATYFGDSYSAEKDSHFRGDPRLATHSTNIWTSSYLVGSDVPFEEQIEGLLNLLEPRIDLLKEILALPGVEGELFLGFSSSNGQGGTSFSPELLSRVAACGLSITLDLYPPSGNDEESR